MIPIFCRFFCCDRRKEVTCQRALVAPMNIGLANAHTGASREIQNPRRNCGLSNPHSYVCPVDICGATMPHFSRAVSTRSASRQERIALVGISYKVHCQLNSLLVVVLTRSFFCPFPFLDKYPCDSPLHSAQDIALLFYNNSPLIYQSDIQPCSRHNAGKLCAIVSRYFAKSDTPCWKYYFCSRKSYFSFSLHSLKVSFFLQKSYFSLFVIRISSKRSALGEEVILHYSPSFSSSPFRRKVLLLFICRSFESLPFYPKRILLFLVLLLEVAHLGTM